MGRRGRAATTPVLHIIIMAWPVKAFFEASVLSTPRWPPIAPSCRSASTSARSSSGITNWIIGSLPSGGSNRRHMIPSWTNSWSQSCRSLREDRLALPISSAACFSPASLPRSIRPRVDSASCASWSLWIGGGSGGHTVTAETCFSASKSWLSLPHC